MTEKKGRLLAAGGLSDEQIQNAIVKCSSDSRSLIESVLADDRVSEEGLADSLAAYARFPRVNLASANIDPEAVKLLPQEQARRFFCFPIRLEGRHMLVAMANPTDFNAMREVEFKIGRPLKVLVCTRTEILDALAKFYQPEETLRGFTENLEEAQDFAIVGTEGMAADVDLSETRTQAELPPVIKVVNLIIQDAIAQGATDIHIEPTVNDVQVRVRVDGVLRSLMQLPKWLSNPVSSRMKVLARLDIAEKRVPQDGRMKVQQENKSYDLRVSTLPTLFGEKVVLRILASGTDLPTLEQVNLEPDDLKTLMRSLMQPQGLILVTGPTGSGKSTSLYASLGYRMSPEVNIVTVEDPVEYQMRGLNQVQVNVKAGLTFASCLRSILRQDPDVILVGEMRDLETTEIAFHAAMTGHMVLSTQHTNNALATISRLLDLGVDPVLITSSITLITAQRLLRKLCESCKQPYEPAPGLLERLGATPDGTQYFKAEGCDRCGGTGFTGRMAIHEMVPMTNTLREMIVRKAAEVEMQQAMRAQGMKFLLERGMEKVRAGTTAISELFRVLQMDEPAARIADNLCPSCKAMIESDFSVCPNCLTSLKILCPACNGQLKVGWKICPYCRAPVTPGSEGAEATEDTSARLLAVHAGTGQGAAPVEAPTPAAAKAPDGPTQAQAPSNGGQSATEELAPTKTPCILIADDDQSIRMIVAKSLQQLPFEVKTELASDGTEAVEMAGKSHPDLIVLDIMMPGMDGFAVCEKLRSQVETAFIPIMMLTANPSEEGRIRGYMVGTDDYVSKPFNVAELNARVTRLLRRAYGIS